ncbi:Cold-inducible RNA-binding protein [Trichoplax sp. H2]|uniref:RRM domain-containing protein n=1 Tax=Trichoplax adhaerens TaxID=10228 RepID=B3RIY8_TRIAD|nr:expressed hypothetical protein [Trichoplax adhaerens]EDV28473.1 expressed hypothetical protein [Trichoplax adhaerens]RDD39261.1 Cold-inducible RNA-binding protein [Trichoplax sp. H2]|eukprot:XP_002107675.1 expressed hypothetical protein [Trichoplax adhaerens]
MNGEETQEVAEDGTRLFIGGLSSEVDNTKLREAFQQYGRLREAFVTVDRMSGRSRGFGFVSFYDPEDAQDAIDQMTGKELCGRSIRVSHAVKQTDRDSGNGRRGGGGGRGRGRGRGGGPGGFRRKPYSDPRGGRDMDRGGPRAGGPPQDYNNNYYNKYGGDSDRQPYSRENRDSGSSYRPEAASYQPDYRSAPSSGYGTSAPYNKEERYGGSQPQSRGGYGQRRGSGGHRGGYRSNVPSNSYSVDDRSSQSHAAGMYPSRASEGYARRGQPSTPATSGSGSMGGGAAAAAAGVGGGYRGSWKDSNANRGDRFGRDNPARQSYPARPEYQY